MDSLLYIPESQQSLARMIPTLADGSLPNDRLRDLHRTLSSSIIEPSTLPFFEREIALYRESFFSLKAPRQWRADQERQSRLEQLSREERSTP